MLSISDLPALNASLNAISAVLLCVGRFFISRGRIRAHKTCMISAFCVSTLFLVSYISYHAHHLTKHFHGPDLVRWVYFPILISHTILAIVIVPLVLITLSRALRGIFDKHKAIARWTWPIWLYVSVTGVIVYWMLYQLYP